MPHTPQFVHRTSELPARLLRTALLFAIGFLVIRTVIVEPFGVPTGSMAPALLGNHRECPCPRCGYPVVVGEMPDLERRNPYANATCDNCGKRGIDLTHSPDIPGDRLLVDKNVFSIRPPRRWELGVFRCPVDPTTPYVKRVVGLPGEQVQIIGGDLFVNGDIVRKSYAELKQMLVPVFDSNFEPESGWTARWQVDSANPSRQANETEWKDGTLTLDASKGKDASVTYRHTNPDTLREEPIRDVMAYNAATGVGRPEAVHDFLLEFDSEVIAVGGFGIHLTNGSNRIAARFGLESGHGISLDPGNGSQPIDDMQFESLKPGKMYHMTLGLVDQRTIFHVDGREVIPPQDLPADPSAHGKRPGTSNPFQFETHEGTIRISSIRLLRDVHYRTDGANGIDVPYQLGPNDFFVLGDNSANSRDSRVWKIPGVPRDYFLGKPFLIHQPMHLGRVPLNGQDRTFPTLDWQRLRWVR